MTTSEKRREWGNTSPRTKSGESIRLPSWKELRTFFMLHQWQRSQIAGVLAKSIMLFTGCPTHKNFLRRHLLVSRNKFVRVYEVEKWAGSKSYSPRGVITYACRSSHFLCTTCQGPIHCFGGAQGVARVYNKLNYRWFLGVIYRLGFVRYWVTLPQTLLNASPRKPKF